MKKKTQSARSAKTAKAAKAAKPARPAKAAKPAKSARSAKAAKPAKAAKLDAKNGAGYVWHPKPHPPRKRKPKDNLEHVVDLLRALGPNFYVPGRPLPNPRRPDSTYP